MAVRVQVPLRVRRTADNRCIISRPSFIRQLQNRFAKIQYVVETMYTSSLQTLSLRIFDLTYNFVTTDVCRDDVHIVSTAASGIILMC